MKSIYLDTNIWNYFCDQKTDAAGLVAALASKDSVLVLGSHNVYELAKTFIGRNAQATVRGTELFSTIKTFLNQNIAIGAENMELLKLEVLAFGQNVSTIDPLIKGADYATVTTEVGKLAAGAVEGKVKDFLQKRSQFAADSRTEQIDHFAGRQDMKRRLNTIPETDLPQWLQTETVASGGPILASHLVRQFGPGPTSQYASKLLASPVANVSRSIVRADLYSNWRCANRDSNPRDLIDDMLHVLQAVYCDIYVTAEPKQLDYGSLLLTPNTKVAIYDGKKPIDQWLLSVA